ncbi:CoA-transferase family III domain-containing protein [Fennellomyces sp. T-0311]|nr:CoA-transferase family III domain-containing protein [Fennellomyces sp. T-0311]
MKSEGGRKLLHDLVRESDVLVENYLPGKLAKMGMGYEQLKEINPKLVYASITGYGQTGPYADRPGYDVIIEAEAGLMHITGEPDGSPVKVGVAITDLTTGLYANSAILAALIKRGVTGKGQWIDCSLIESQVASLANISSNFLIGGREAKRMGTSHPSIVPYQVLPTKDSFVMIGAGNDGQFAKLCNRMGLEKLLDNPKFATNPDRVRHREELIQLLIKRLTEEPSEYWLDKLTGAGFPFAPINNIQQTFEHPQIKARGLVQEVEHERAGPIKLVGKSRLFRLSHSVLLTHSTMSQVLPSNTATSNLPSVSPLPSWAPTPTKCSRTSSTTHPKPSRPCASKVLLAPNKKDHHERKKTIKKRVSFPPKRRMLSHKEEPLFTYILDFLLLGFARHGRHWVLLGLHFGKSRQPLCFALLIHNRLHLGQRRHWIHHVLGLLVLLLHLWHTLGNFTHQFLSGLDGRVHRSLVGTEQLDTYTAGVGPVAWMLLALIYDRQSHLLHRDSHVVRVWVLNTKVFPDLATLGCCLLCVDIHRVHTYPIFVN